MIPTSNDDAFVIAGQVYDDFYRCGDLKATTSMGLWATKVGLVAATRGTAYGTACMLLGARGPVTIARLVVPERAVLARPCGPGDALSGP